MTGMEGWRRGWRDGETVKTGGEGSECVEEREEEAAENKKSATGVPTLKPLSPPSSIHTSSASLICSVLSIHPSFSKILLSAPPPPSSLLVSSKLITLLTLLDFLWTVHLALFLGAALPLIHCLFTL